MFRQLRLCIGLLLFIAISFDSLAQRIATFVVEPVKGMPGKAMPVHVDLDAITILPDSVLALYENSGKHKTPVAFQIQNKGGRTLTWIIAQKQSAGKLVYELHKEKPTSETPVMKAEKANGALTLSFNDHNLLRYNYATHYPPMGVDTVFRRSGFIHPLWSPNGKVLTRINPPDHYHHYGLWNPWTKVLYDGKIFDFWNLNSKQGTVRFENFVSVNEGSVFSEYQVVHDHVAMMGEGVEKVILNELQTVTVYKPTEENPEYYIADISIRLNCAAGPVTLKEYRYGGLGFRATEQWNKDNSIVITSEGKDRKDADGSKARWCLIQGAINNDQAGLVMMSSPTNYNHPEPLRVWPENIFGRGDMYANFVPIKDMDWHLEPGKDYVLNYRFLVYDGNITPDFAEASWQFFAHPPVIRIKKDRIK